jgi:hypothetical protein
MDWPKYHTEALVSMKRVVTKVSKGNTTKIISIQDLFHRYFASDPVHDKGG